MATGQRCYGYKSAIATKCNSGNVCSLFVFASRRNEGNFSLSQSLVLLCKKRTEWKHHADRIQHPSVPTVPSGCSSCLFVVLYTHTRTSFNSWQSLENWRWCHTCVTVSDGILLLVKIFFVIFFCHSLWHAHHLLKSHITSVRTQTGSL